jgi:hypothetical protein
VFVTILQPDLQDRNSRFAMTPQLADGGEPNGCIVLFHRIFKVFQPVMLLGTLVAERDRKKNGEKQYRGKKPF